MVYGLISGLDNETTVAVFNSKGITEENVFSCCLLGELIQRLKKGDTVYSISINRFETVSQLLVFGKICMGRGISLHFICQPYLDLGNGKQWKNSIVAQMQCAVNAERCAKGRMAQGFKMSKEQWEYVFRCFEIMNLEILAKIYSGDGIMKRGG
jgi:hypothetical protein